MQTFRYPELKSLERLIPWANDLIRTLLQRDESIPNVQDVFGNVVSNSEVNYNLQKTDAVVVNDTSLSIVNNYLPTAKDGKGKAITLKRLGTDDLIVNPSSGETIDGNADVTLTAEGQITVRSDGFNWFIIAR